MVQIPGVPCEPTSSGLTRTDLRACGSPPSAAASASDILRRRRVERPTAGSPDGQKSLLPVAGTLHQHDNEHTNFDANIAF